MTALPSHKPPSAHSNPARPNPSCTFVCTLCTFVWHFVFSDAPNPPPTPASPHLHGEPRLDARQRDELRGGHLVRPAGHTFGSVARHAARPYDDSRHPHAALHRRDHRPRRPPPPR